MSSVNKKRIKGLRRYTQNSETSFSSMIPFGVDGDLVDSFSGLDLEEELLIGGQKIISFEENQDQLIVKQKYYNQVGECCYSKVSTITSAPTYQLIHAEGENGEEGQLGNTVNEEYFIGDFLGNLQLQIIISLYKGDIDDSQNSTLLHTKNIEFKNIQVPIEGTQNTRLEKVIEESIQNFELPYEEEEEEEEP